MAGNLYEFIIRAKDEASKVLKDVAGNVASSSKGFKQQFADMSGASSTLALGLGGLTVAAGLFGKSAIDRASEMENLGAQFQTFTKSADTAKKMMEDINKFAASTPFETIELADASKKLLAFGVHADDVIDSLQNLGDIASATGQPISELAELYGKAKTQGRLYGEDINQLLGRGIPIIQALAKQFGVAEDEVKGLVEQGKIGFPEMKAALESMTTAGGMFEGGMLAQSKTFSGMMSTFQDSISIAMAEVGTAMLPMMKALLGSLIEFANHLPEISKQFVGFATALINNKPALVGIAVAIATMLTPAAITAAAALWAMVAPLLPLIAIGVAVGAVAYGIYAAWESNFLGIQGIVASVVATITPIWNAMVLAIQTGLQLMQPMWEQFTMTLQTNFAFIQTTLLELQTLFTNVFITIKGIVEPIITSMTAVIQSNWDHISTLLTGTLNVIQGAFQIVWSTIQGIVNAALAVLRGDISGAMDIMKNTIVNVWDGIKTYIGGIFDQIKGITGAAWDGINNLTGGKLGEISGKIGDTWNNVTTNTGGFFTNLGTTFSTGWENLKTSVVNFATSFVAEVQRFMQGALDAAWALVPDFLKIGQNAAMGLTDGFASKMTAQIGVISAKVQSMAKAARDALEVKSPSRVFAEIGAFTAMGLQQGFLGGIDKLNAKIPSAIGGMVSATGGATEDMARPSFTPIATSAGGATTNTTNNISITLNAEGQDADTLTKQVLERLTRELQLIQLGAIR